MQQAVLRVEQGKVQLSLRGGFATPRYRVSLSDDRRQLRVDLPGMTLGKRGLRVQGKAGLVHKSRIRRLRRGLRLTLALRQPVTYRARGQAGHIALWLEAVPATALTAKTQQANRAGAQVRALRLQRREERERIVIEIDAHTDYQVEAGTGGQRILRLRHCRLPQKVARQAARLRGDVVGPVQVEQRGTQTLITVTPEAGARATALRRGKRIVWIFAPPQGPSARPRSVTVARERWGGREEGEAPSTEVAGFHTALPLQIGGARRPRRYRGRRIDLDFKDADIHNILRLIAEVGQVNVVTSDDVAGMVTIRMRGVPWDEALAVILQAKGLGMVRRGNMIRVAPLTALEKEREAEIARAKQQEQLAPLETRLVPVSYATAEELQPRVRELLSSRGSVSVDVRTNMLVVRDITDNLSDVEALVRTLDTQTPQVLIEARIVEASSQYARDVGIQWGGDATMSTATGNPTGLNFPANVGIAGGNFDAQTPTQGLSPFSGAVNPSNFAVNLPAITGTGQGGALGMTFGSLDGNFNLNVRLSAAESNGIIRIISSPRILTLDNNEANI
ncbi:MAG: secretin N-terminal domain-containing protein, partial [Polyangiales bacterium]